MRLGVDPFDFYLLSPRELSHMFLAHAEGVKLDRQSQYEVARFQSVLLINHFLAAEKQYKTFKSFHTFDWETAEVQSMESMLETMKGIAATQNREEKTRMKKKTKLKKKGK